MRASFLALCVLATGCDLALGLADYEGSGGAGAGPTTTTGGEGGVGGQGGEGGAGGSGGAPRPYLEVVLADDPVGYWRLDDAEGDPRIALDLSDNHYDGTYLGELLLEQPSLIMGQNAAIALSGGVGDYVEIGDVLDYAINAAFTVEAWVRPTDSDAGDIVAKLEKSGWRLVLTDTDTQFLRALDGQAPQIARGARIPTGVASHVVGRYDGAQICLFIDGVEIQCRSSELALSDEAVALRLGQAVTGALDEVAVYSEALDDTRILAHYEAGRPDAP